MTTARFTWLKHCAAAEPDRLTTKRNSSYRDNFMEIWHEELNNDRPDTNVIDGYLPGFNGTLRYLRRQRNFYREIGKLMRECQTLQQKLDRKNRKLVIGM
jgi:hypothetical protein